jgi:MFS transporter, PAT family, beta-lactamase induction signal transducer AmpG
VTAANGLGAAWLHRRIGLSPARGSLLVDAALTGVGVAILIVMVAVTRRRPERQPSRLGRDAPSP